jgi:beta-1,4-mannosyl-glycoprotein beta-1,4-N-acetylglucosaminyltransferase
MYFDEDLLLEIRLETLFNHVDQFIIVEANLDHAGNERKPQFDIKKFTKYKDKIKYILLKDLPRHNNFYKKNWGPAWRRENLQRNALSRGYESSEPDDLIMISNS